MRSKMPLLLVVGALFVFVGASVAQVTGNYGTPPKLVPYNGHLENNGIPVNGTVDLEFFVVTSPTESPAAALWRESHPDVLVSAGSFSVVLGYSTSFGTLFSEQGELYVGVSVYGVALAGRQRLTSSPYSIAAGEAQNFTVSGTLTAGHVQASTINSNALTSNTLTTNTLTTNTLTTNGATTFNGAVNIPTVDPVIRGVRLSGGWSGFPDGGDTGRAEIANDTGVYKALMIAGNRSNGGPRRVNLYDDVSVGGNFVADNNRHDTCSDVQVSIGASNFSDNADGHVFTGCPEGQFMMVVWTKHYQEGSNFRDRYTSYISCCRL